jgi:hypothetical protein
MQDPANEPDATNLGGRGSNLLARDHLHDAFARQDFTATGARRGRQLVSVNTS